MVFLDWFIFNPLTVDDFINHFQIKTEEAEYHYHSWLEEYNRIAYKFYFSQYKRHYLYEFHNFCLYKEIKFSTPDELYESCASDNYDVQYYNQWIKWVNQSYRLQKHKQEKEEAIKQISSLIWTYSSSKRPNTDIYIDVKSFWFNLNIKKPSPDELVQLKSLSYPDYLESSHWKKVRSAMLLIKEARCTLCDDLSDSFYGGWEPELDVHHLSYQNFGCERYEDLDLLCKKHHRMVHST